MITQEQIDRLMVAAAGDLGPECGDDWVLECERILESAPAELERLRAENEKQEDELRALRERV